MYTKQWWLTAILAMLTSAGCVTESMDRLQQRTAGLVSERTSAREVYDPKADEMIAGKIAGLLDGGLTVDEAVQITLLNNKGFQAMFHQLGASRAEVVQSRLLNNPTLTFSLMFPEGGGRSKLNTGFGQELASLWQIPIRTRIAKDQLEETVLAIGSRAVELASEVKTRCYQILATEQVLDAVRQTRDLLEESVSYAQKLLEAGQVTQFDVNLAKTGVLEADSERVALERDMQIARIGLSASMGLSRETATWRLIGSLPEPGDLPDEDTLLLWAMEKRLDAQVLRYQTQAAEDELRRQYLSIFPSLIIGTELERSENRAPPGRKVAADTARTSITQGKPSVPDIQSRAQRDLEKRQIIDSLLGPSLQITLPVFDQNQAQIAKARHTAEQKRKEYESMLDSVAMQIRQAITIAKSNHELVRFYKDKALPQAKENLEGARDLYQAGLEDIHLLIDMQRALLGRRKDHQHALRDYAVAMAELEKAIGGCRPDQAEPAKVTTMPTSQP